MALIFVLEEIMVDDVVRKNLEKNQLSFSLPLVLSYVRNLKKINLLSRTLVSVFLMIILRSFRG